MKGGYFHATWGGQRIPFQDEALLAFYEGLESEARAHFRRFYHAWISDVWPCRTRER